MTNFNPSVLQSWQANADEWDKLLEAKGIPSRVFTNKAILEALNSYNPKRILDVGCGEGWISRELNSDIEYTGIDGTSLLIEKAKQKNPQGSFHCLTYDQIIGDNYRLLAKHDLIVINYALYQKDNLIPLLQKLNFLLDDDGVILIQTVHPFFLLKNLGSYKSSWIENAWEGLEGNFKAPHSWYCRTFQDWFTVFKEAGFMTFIQEVSSKNGEPISVIFNLSHT